MIILYYNYIIFFSFLVKDFPYVLANESIQKDIMTYGPIESSFDVYDDFMSYNSGKCNINKNILYKKNI